jgi:hypothetical protein
VNGSDVLKIAIGWVLGVLTIYLANVWTDANNAQRVARLLSVEVNRNAAAVQAYASIGQRLRSTGAITDDKGTPPPTDLRAISFVAGSDFQSTMFSATLEKQALLPDDVFKALHDFYAGVSMMERSRLELSNIPEGAPIREALFRAFLEKATRTWSMYEKAGLGTRLEEEARRSPLRRLFRLGPSPPPARP